MQNSEVIRGQVLAKANHYMSVPGKDGERRIIKDEAIREYERNFTRQCKVYRGKHIDGRFHLNIIVWHSSNRYDLDNSLKTVLDCLQYVDAITDDKNCVRINAEKRLDPRNPRIEFNIVPEQGTLTLV